MTVLPYKDQRQSKKEQVATMFNNVSPKYDLLNRLLSMGIDIYWRKRAIRLLKKEPHDMILDVATGTGDFAIEALSLKPKKIVGVDISEGMLEVGRKKLEKLKLTDKITLALGDSEKLNFEDNTFDAATVAFGVRNYENLVQGLADMKRVLKPGGSLLVLEFSMPETFPFKQIYNFYFKNILPMVGRMISKDSSAYTYLPESVEEFPYGERFVNILKNKVGFKSVRCIPLTFGISSIYLAKK
ncbi:bifunctional demethylmenaquinone methyltransferase/2-methoxy-6-polyprenyl-1,4-benzoquinol methylase UbiE [Rapidithrix thailandica]|uniref:Demethylmenaquinone methyltransferase n=1 Tax=Rapidithrix thailandica TaxID=413964 RepID=A0AAW9SGE6_9BACT